MKKILILQWPGSSEGDFNALVEMEDALEAALGDAHEVDGHDFGSGEMTIFIVTESAEQAFESVRSILSDRQEWATVRAAYRNIDGETFELLWPIGLKDFKVE